MMVAASQYGAKNKNAKNNTLGDQNKLNWKAFVTVGTTLLCLYTDTGRGCFRQYSYYTHNGSRDVNGAALIREFTCPGIDLTCEGSISFAINCY